MSRYVHSFFFMPNFHLTLSNQKIANLGSQIGDERPISQVRFAPNNDILATGSWSGTVKLWNIPACTPIRSLRGHSDRVGGVAWHPQATLSQSPSLVNLVSGGGEGSVNLWSTERWVFIYSDFKKKITTDIGSKVNRLSLWWKATRIECVVLHSILLVTM